MNIQRFKFFPQIFGLSTHTQILAVLNDIAILLPVFLIIFTWRGFMQALIAKIVGDDTAEQEGFLTLNPLAHIDLIGLLVIIFVFFFVGGFFHGLFPRAILLMILIMLGVRWTIPIPINDQKFKHYRIGGTLLRLSGPFSNILLAFIATGLMKAGLLANLPPYITITVLEIFKTLIDISLFFGVLNLVPLPPFDGGNALRYALPDSCQHIVAWLEEHSLFIFLVLFLVPGVSDLFFGTLLSISLAIKHMMLSVFF